MTQIENEVKESDAKYEKDKRSVFIKELFMVLIFSAFAIYCLWHYGQ